MKTLVVLLGLGLMVCGCVHYTPDMGPRERIVARYEQTYPIPQDPPSIQSFKTTKRVCLDVITLCMMEMWYGRVRHSYAAVMADETGWNTFSLSVKGKPLGEVLAVFGPPARTQDLGNDRKMVIYERRSVSGEMVISGGMLRTMGVLGTLGGAGSFVSSENVRQSWLVVDANNVVVDTGRNWWNLGLSSYP